MSGSAPAYVEVDLARVGEFQGELTKLMSELAKGEHQSELQAKGIVLPPSVGVQDLWAAPNTSQPVAAELVIVLAIHYSPLLNQVGKDLWAWAWPKIRNRLDGAAREADDT